MSLLDVLRKKLTPEKLAEVEEALGDDFDYDVVPRSRLNKVITERNELRTQVTTLIPDDVDKPKATADPEGVKKKVLTQADVDAAVAAVKAEATKEREQDNLKLAITEKLRSAKAKKPELLIPQLKMDKVKIDDLSDIDIQVTAWQKSDPYLFGEITLNGTGADGKEAGKSDLASLQTQHAEAVKSGNTALAVALKRTMNEK